MIFGRRIRFMAVEILADQPLSRTERNVIRAWVLLCWAGLVLPVGLVISLLMGLI